MTDMNHYDRQQVSYEARKRREALAKPWPRRWYAYMNWLWLATPDPWGDLLMLTAFLAHMVAVGAIVALLIAVTTAIGPWVLAFVAGATLVPLARRVLREALATDRTYRDE